jgi:hypothetical protein
MPWRSLREAAPNSKPPSAGDQWRVNFSRVQWTLDIVDGTYRKRLKPNSKDPLPEDNWVWSPQGAINMHMPERWGFVQFSGRTVGAESDTFVENPNERVKWALRRVYYRQRAHRAKTGAYATSFDALDVSTLGVEGIVFRPTMHVTPSMYEVAAPGFGGVTLHIDQDGRVWTTK